MNKIRCACAVLAASTALGGLLGMLISVSSSWFAFMGLLGILAGFTVGVGAVAGASLSEAVLHKQEMHVRHCGLTVGSAVGAAGAVVLTDGMLPYDSANIAVAIFIPVIVAAIFVFVGFRFRAKIETSLQSI
ncbi:hypothetical protein [Timonella sp. A28]|uniref:hypothetical protein n=1 Tax=Timonella sp. A28 TaxID=3442640 RepID=UPI003EBB84BD